MFAMSLVESTDNSVSYGILFCENDEISENDIQQEIYKIKKSFEDNDINEWVLDDVIARFPSEWRIWLQESNETIEI